MPSDVAAIELDGWITLAVLLLLLVTLIRDWVTPDVAMMGAVLLLLLTSVVSAGEVLEGLADPTLVVIGSLLVVAAAVRDSGALSWLHALMQPRSSDPGRAVVRVMLPSAAISAFMNNTPIVAILAPLVQRWSRAAGIAPSRLLLPMTFAATLGGMVTLLGTSTNLIVVGLMASAGLPRPGLFDLAWVGIPSVVVGVLFFATVGHRLLPDRDGTGPVDDGGLREYEFELLVPDESPLIGKTIGAAGLRGLRDAYLGHIRRAGGGLIEAVRPDEMLQHGDVLAFVGSATAVERFVRSGSLVPRTGDDDRSSLKLFEAVISTTSALAGSTLRESRFRDRHQGVVVGIHRGGGRLAGSLGTTPLRPGDLLLIEARAGFEERAAESGDFYLVAPLRESVAPSRRTTGRTLLIVTAMIAAIALDLVSLPIATLGAAVLLIVFGSISGHDARRSIDLAVLLVIAGGFVLGSAMEASGLAPLLAAAIVDVAGSWGWQGALAAVFIVTVVLTEFLSNNAAAILVFPVALAAANATGGSPVAFAVAVAIGASTGFATPIGYQTNLMVMGPGGYRFVDYLRVGIPLDVLVGLVAVPIIALRWG